MRQEQIGEPQGRSRSEDQDDLHREPEFVGGTVLAVDDIPANLNVLLEILKAEGYEILGAPSGEIALQIVQRTVPDLILLDVVMKGIDGFETCRRLKADPRTARIPVIFITIRDEMERLVEGFSVGGVDYINKPFQKEELLARVRTHLKIRYLTEMYMKKNAELTAANRELQQEIAMREQEERARQKAENELLKAEDGLRKADEQLSIISEWEASRWGIEGFVGKSKTIAAILEDVRKLQEAGATGVLILGESGTGKELIARAIHFGSVRSRGPFYALNCSAIPEQLAESYLFGHIKGAFTGAVQSRKGYFELASGGTLFLDEIGDMPQELQTKLLRVLEDGSFMPVGGTAQKQVDVRVLAATNADLQTKIAEGRFRSDLYFRLARFTVTVPPLRERKEDIPLLASHFLGMFATEMGRERARLSHEALNMLEEYHFPGNIRELKNIMEYAIIKSGSSVILPQHLPLLELPDASGTSWAASGLSDKAFDLMIKGALLETDGDIEAAAQLLSIEPGRIYKYTQVRQGKSIYMPEMDEAAVEYAPQSSEEKRVLEYVKTHGSINNSECQELLEVDLNHASYLLRKLHRRGALNRESEKRWARYCLP